MTCQTALVAHGQRFRAGLLYPISSIVIGLLFCAGMLLAGALAFGATAEGTDTADRVWPLIGGILSILGFTVGLVTTALGFNGFRPVVLDDNSIKLPIFTLRHGFSQMIIPLYDVAGVEMVYRSAPRNGRWRLSVIRCHNPNVECDSLTSARSRQRGLSGTAAAREADRLRHALPADRLTPRKTA